jgi:predicted transcriptional regulator
MNKFLATMVIQPGEVEEILEELEKAKETIYRCYTRLQELGFVEIRENKDAASGN